VVRLAAVCKKCRTFLLFQTAYMFRTVHTRSIRAEISAIRFRSSFFSRRLSITLARRRPRRKSAFRRPAHGGHYPTRACTVRSVFRSRKHVCHVCHGRRGPGRPGTHAEPAPRPMRRRDVDSARQWICARGFVATYRRRPPETPRPHRLDSLAAPSDRSPFPSPSPRRPASAPSPARLSRPAARSSSPP